MHHLEDPFAGVSSLARLVRPRGELHLYVYRTLAEEGALRQGLLSVVTAARRVTSRLPPRALHTVSWLVGAAATVLFLLPRWALRGWSRGERLTRQLPLVQYADVPFRMLVAEQYNRFGAPLEHRHSQQELRDWVERIGFELISVKPGQGWRLTGRRPGE